MAISIILVMLAAVAASEAWLIVRLQRRTAALIEHTAKLAEIVSVNMKALGAVKELIDANMKHLDALDEGFEAATHNSCEFERELAEVKDKLDALSNEFNVLSDEFNTFKITFDTTVEELMEAETEKARAEAKSEEAWTKGVSNIIGYGDDIPMVSMEGVYGRK